jgi:N-acetylneuraminic acid mutarotase
MSANLSLGLVTKVALWLTVCGVCVIPTALSLNFSSAISGTLFDKARQGKGFTPVQANSTGNATVNADTDNFRIQLAASTNASFTRIGWSTVAPSSIGRSEAPGVVADRKLYVFGGYIDTTYTPTRRADVYNPVNNTWTRITDLPKGLTHSGTAVDGKDIYIAGGYPAKPASGQIFATRDVWKYNVDTNTWTAMPPLPQARGSGALERLGRKLHFFGGSDINRADKGDHWILALDSGTGWTPAAPLPNPRNHLADAVLDGKLYAIGGQRGQNHAGTQASVHVWDPAKPNTWTAVASLPRARSHISAATFVMGDQIVVIGGLSAQGRDVSDVTAYNPITKTWTALTPLPAARSSGVAGSIGNQIFYTTGAAKFSSTTYKGAILGYQTRLYSPPVARSL